VQREKPWRPKFVYLDLNHWIYLAQAESGNPEREHYRLALEMASKLVSTGNAVFPVSAFHFMEVAKIADAARRKKLANLMMRLSQGLLLSAASSLLVDELRMAVAKTFKRNFQEHAIASVTRSLKAAFGSMAAASMPQRLDELASEPAFLEDLLANGRLSKHLIEKAEIIAEDHENARKSAWDVSRQIRKRLYCARLTLGIQSYLLSVLREFDLGFTDLENLGPDGMVGLLESVPPLDVEISLHTERNEHRDRRIEPNDEFDLGFLSMAIPYCHVVATERFWTSLVHRAKLDKKYGTKVGHDLSELLQSAFPSDC